METKVYKNLILAIKCRGGNITSALIDDQHIVTTLRNAGVIRIEANRGEESILGAAQIMTYLLAPASKVTMASDDFKKKVGGDIEKLKKSTTVPLEILIIAEMPPSRYVQKIADGQKNQRCRIGFHPYSIFSCETPRHISVLDHTIADADTVKFLEEVLCTPAHSMPQIRENEAQAVWIGARPGMVVQISRISDNSGIITCFRVCVSGNIEIDKKKKDDDESSSSED